MNHDANNFTLMKSRLVVDVANMRLCDKKWTL